MPLGQDLLKVFPGGSLAADQCLLRGTFTICNKVGPCPPANIATRATEGAVGGTEQSRSPRLTSGWTPASLQGPIGASNRELAAEKHSATQTNFFLLMISVWPGGCLPDCNRCWHRHLRAGQCGLWKER